MAGAANWWEADAHAPSITGVIPAAPRKQSEILRDTRTAQEIENNPLDTDVKRQSLKKSRTDQALSMAQDYNSNPDVKAYNSILPTYAAALESPDTPAGDQGLVYAMAKVMQADGSAVRSEEVQNTESLQPYIDQIKALVSAAVGLDPQRGDQVAVMDDGRVVHRGRMAELAADLPAQDTTTPRTPSVLERAGGTKGK